MQSFITIYHILYHGFVCLLRLHFDIRQLHVSSVVVVSCCSCASHLAVFTPLDLVTCQPQLCIPYPSCGCRRWCHFSTLELPKSGTALMCFVHVDLKNVLRATAAQSFLTSRLPKVPSEFKTDPGTHVYSVFVNLLLRKAE